MSNDFDTPIYKKKSKYSSNVYEYTFKRDCFKDSSCYPDKFIFAKDESYFSKKTNKTEYVKRYCFARSLEDFIKMYKKTPQKDRNFHELIWKRHYEFYDIDLKIPTGETQYTNESVFNWFVNIRKEFIETNTVNGSGSGFRAEPKWTVSTSTNNSKISLHIINKSVIFMNNSDFKEFFGRFVNFVKRFATDKILANSIDINASNSEFLFRIIGCSKITDSSRLLIPWNPDGQPADQTFQIKDYLITEPNYLDFDETCQKLVSPVNYLHWLTHEEKRTFDPKSVKVITSENVKELLELLSDTRAEEYQSWSKIGFILKDYPDEYFLEFSQRCPQKYNYHECLKLLKNARSKSMDTVPLTLGTLHYYAKIDNPVGYYEYISGCTKYIPKTNFTPDETINKQYLDLDFYTKHFEHYDTVAIKSNMKTGKTYCLRDLISDPKESCLFIYSRVSLCENKFEEFRNTGFKIYNNKGSDHETLNSNELVTDYIMNTEKYNKIIIQADSMHRLRGPINTVILDEAESLVEHLIGSPHIKSKAQYNAIMSYVRNCKRLIIADANLTDTTVQLFTNFRQSCIKVQNDYMSMSDTKCTYISDKNELLSKVISDIEQGLKLVIPTNIKKTSIEIHKLLTKYFPKKKFLLLNSSTEHVSASLWNQYDCIIYTSKISAGISFNDIYFDRLYGIFTNTTCSVQMCSQMLIRVRNLKDKQMFLCVARNRKNLSRSLTETDISEDIKTKIITGAEAKLTDGKIQIDHYNNKVHIDDYFKMYMYYTKNRNLTYLFFKSGFDRILRSHGIQIENNSTKNTTVDKVKEDMKNIGETIKKEQLQSIINAPDLAKEDYETLKTKTNKTESEVLSVKKYYIKDVFELQELTEDFLKKNIKIISGYANYKEFKDTPLEKLEEYAIKQHTEMYDSKLIREFNNDSLPSGSDTESSDSDQEPIKQDGKLVFENNFKRIHKRHERIRQRLTRLKSVRSTVFTAINYNPRWLRMKICSEILKLAGFEKLSDEKRVVLDWYKLRDYLAKNERRIRNLFDSSIVIFKDPRLDEESDFEDEEDIEDDDIEDRSKKVLEKMKNQIINYINPKLSRIFGISIFSATKRGTKHIISKLFSL